MGHYCMLIHSDTKKVLISIHLPEWIVDLGKLAVFQKGVNQQPLLYWHIQQYLLYRWGIEDMDANPTSLEYWDY